MEFKTGDRVQCNTYIGIGYSKKIYEGIIIGKNSCDLYCIEFDDKMVSLHAGNGFKDITTGKEIKGKDNHCWYLDESKLVLIKRYDINKRI
jgi:hypothetical protein